MAEKSQIDLPENSGPGTPGTSTGGLVMLGSILVVCVVVAYFLSTLITQSQPPVEEPTNPPEGQAAAGPSRSLPEEALAPPGLEAVMFQLRGLASVCGALNTYRDESGQYPLSLEELVEQTGFVLPDNPYLPGTPVQPLMPGDFAAGGISYHRFLDLDIGTGGYILFAYADQPGFGVTIEDPTEIILPSVFDPPIEVPLRGISAAMDDGGNALDLAVYRGGQ